MFYITQQLNTITNNWRRKMPKYYVSVDVYTTYRTEVDAEDEKEAREKAHKEAYEDTWCGKASYSGSRVYELEKMEDASED